MRIIVKYAKNDEAAFTSHLDVQRLFQRALRRAAIPLEYSQGFNPHPNMSFAGALSLGVTSECELMEIRTSVDMDTAEFRERLNSAMPRGFFIAAATVCPNELKNLTAATKSASYIVTARGDGVDKATLEECVSKLKSGEIVVEKNTKGGLKNVDIRPMLYELEVKTCQSDGFSLFVDGQFTSKGSLPVNLLLNRLFELLGKSFVCDIHRLEIGMEGYRF